VKVLVTGGAGYIGSLLCPMLLAAGHHVILLDRFLFGPRPILHFSTHPKLEIVTGDVRDRALVQGLVAKADVVIHLAAIVGFPACSADEALATTTNVGGTRNVADALSKQQMFFFASTGSTYGRVEGVANEDFPINPLTVYGRTKQTGEEIVREKGGVSLRFATVFGVSPRLRLDLLVNDFVYQALHLGFIVMFEGHHRRTFLHAVDAARVYLFAIENWARMRGDTFNVGSSAMNYTKREVAMKIMAKKKFYLHEAQVGEDKDKRDYEVCYEKIANLGYTVTRSLDEGIDELLAIVPLVKMASEWRNA
jgi:nucleoside-diphosphate-sugar epimerase